MKPFEAAHDTLSRVGKYAFCGLVRVYQATLSPDHGPLRRLFPYGVCRYRPTCSQYAIDAVDEHGIIRGIPLALRRIVRCNPWSDGGNDPIVKRK